MEKFSSLKREQKEAIGLLSVGTFLEYFDLMLYVHMAVVLNELFFPKTDPFTASLLSAFSFCSTYLLRPFGAIIFGYMGDYIGRKAVVIVTTFLMSLSCVMIASLPTYAQIGITASWALTLCRIVQGMAATAEARGAEIYLTESSKPPAQYPLVALITVFSAIGTTCAIGVASFFNNVAMDVVVESGWRMAFLVGAGVALIGTVGRTSLKEAEEFTDKKKKLKRRLEEHNMELEALNEEFMNEKTPLKTMLAYFFIQCARPPCFYFIYIYCGDLLKQKCGLAPGAVITQNFWVSLVDLFGIIMLARLSYSFPPLGILRWKLYCFFSVIVFFPAVLSFEATAETIFIFQCLAALFVFDHVPATPIFYKYFPIFKRFTHTSLLSAVAKLMTYFITSFGLVILTEYCGYWGMLIIFIPTGVLFYFSVQYFQKMEDVLAAAPDRKA